MKTSFLEMAIVRYFNFRTNVIVPNVSWGFGLNYEADLMILNKNGYLTEIELKVSKSDMKADLKKRFFHTCGRTKYLYFAFPSELLETALEILPEAVGLLSVNKWGRVKKERKPKIRRKTPISDVDKMKLMRLGVMRYWGAKEKIGGFDVQIPDVKEDWWNYDKEFELF